MDFRKTKNKGFRFTGGTDEIMIYIAGRQLIKQAALETKQPGHKVYTMEK